MKVKKSVILKKNYYIYILVFCHSCCKLYHTTQKEKLKNHCFVIIFQVIRVKCKYVLYI